MLPQIILASNSPRRKDLLTSLGVNVVVETDPIDEDRILESLRVTAPEKKAEILAQRKGESIARKYPYDITLSCDTMVVLGERIYGKPGSREEGQRFLLELSGHQHRVISGLCVARGGIARTSHSITVVKMRTLTPEDVDSYLNHNEYADKAGAYAIQGMGALLVEAIHGDYYNVVGLPLGLLRSELMHFGVDLLHLRRSEDLQGKGPGFS